MTDVIDFDTKRASRPTPFKVRSLADMQGKQIPERDWLIPSILVRRSITLFAGDGGTGKSLMCQQLQVAAAIGVDWMGLPIKGPIQSFAMYCEDDDDELDRRFASICAHYNCEFKDVAENVRYVSRVGEANELVTFKGRGDDARPNRTALFGQVEEEIDSWGAQLVIIDTAADTFLGNENIRPQVRAFINQIRRLSIKNNGGVILTAHPSKSSMVDGSGFSGSTAWNGSVRNRLYLTRPKERQEEEDDSGPTDERVLKIMKSTYGPFGEKIKCRWDAGVFLRTDMGTGRSLIDRLAAKGALYEAARYLVGNGTFCVAGDNTRGSLTAIAAKLPSCKAFSFGMLCSARDELKKDGRLVHTELGPPTKRRIYIRPPDMRYPGEIDKGEHAMSAPLEG